MFVWLIQCSALANIFYVIWPYSYGKCLSLPLLHFVGLRSECFCVCVVPIPGEFLFVLTNLVALHFIFNWKLEKFFQRLDELDFHAPIHFDQLAFSSNAPSSLESGQLGGESRSMIVGGPNCILDSAPEEKSIVKPPPSVRGGLYPLSRASVVPIQEDSGSVVKRFAEYGIL